MDYRDWQKLKQEADNHFWYKARRILITNLLRQALPANRPDQKIIEIGCGTGSQLPLLAQYGSVEGLDISPESIAIAKQSGYNARIFNIETETLIPESTAVIACFDVLEHLKNDELALTKIAQALKPQGIFLFSVPANHRLFGPHDRATGHYRRYRKKEIIQKIKASGLEIQTINYWNSWLFPAIALLRLVKKNNGAGNQTKSDTRPLPHFLNQTLYIILAAETKLINQGIKLPWGLSLYGYATKK